ncbi:MAG: dTMP kinase [Candidatus Thorarchaeota archaeon]
MMNLRVAVFHHDNMHLYRSIYTGETREKQDREIRGIYYLTTESDRKGFLFVLEGIDGSGKTCACGELVEKLQADGYDVIRLREPTLESEWGKEIRDRSPAGELTPEEELELYSRDREWHIANRIQPALDEGNVVLMDRYFFASGAYQSTVLDLHWKEILQLNREKLSAPEPDIVFVLDVPAELGLERATGRTGIPNLQFEKLDRLVKVRQNYLEMVEQDSGTFKVIDACKPLEFVVNEVYNNIIQGIKCRNDSSQR